MQHKEILICTPISVKDTPWQFNLIYFAIQFDLHYNSN